MSSFKRGDDEKVPVLKNKTQGNYVNVYKGIAMDPALSLRDRGMMLTLLSLPDNWNFTTAGLRKILPDGKHSIKSSIDSLQEFGYLTMRFSYEARISDSKCIGAKGNSSRKSTYASTVSSAVSTN